MKFIISIIACSLVFSPVDDIKADYTPPIMMADVIPDSVEDALDVIQEANPAHYVIIVFLIMAVGGLTYAIRILWNKNQELELAKHELQESKLVFALSSTETLKESISIVQSIQEGVGKLSESDTDRIIFQQEVRSHLVNIDKDIDHLNSEIRRQLDKR